jgi:hypothetical protein
MSAPRVRHCDDCRHIVGWTMPTVEGRLICGAGHHPRFYQPRGPTDVSWGYKCRCESFEAVEGVEGLGSQG